MASANVRHWSLLIDVLALNDVPCGTMQMQNAAEASQLSLGFVYPACVITSVI